MACKQIDNKQIETKNREKTMHQNMLTEQGKDSCNKITYPNLTSLVISRTWDEWCHCNWRKIFRDAKILTSDHSNIYTTNTTNTTNLTCLEKRIYNQRIKMMVTYIFLNLVARI